MMKRRAFLQLLAAAPIGALVPPRPPVRGTIRRGPLPSPKWRLLNQPKTTPAETVRLLNLTNEMLADLLQV